MEFKGTKGNWRVSNRTTNGIEGYEIHYSDDGECITDHVYELEDAKLIAAAPDLLRELQKVRLDIKLSGVFRETSPIVQGIDVAIKKALIG